MCDEMKTQANIWFNAKNDLTVGFASNEKHRISLEEAVQKVVSYSDNDDGEDDNEGDSDLPDDEDDSYESVSYVNQFCLRTTTGKRHNAEYFFNTGSLTGDDLIAQIMHVISCYEAVGVKIFGLILDAGGGNKSLYRLLTKRTIDKNKVWLDNDEISFLNPFDPTRRVYITFCAVHGLKAMRNNLLNSSMNSDATHNFFNGWNFGWEQVQLQHKRDSPGAGKVAKAKATRINSVVAKPDKFTKMSVSHALIVFEFKTLMHEIHYIAQELGMLKEIIQKIPESDDKNESKRLFQLFDLLKDEATKRDQSITGKIGEAVANLEFRLHVHRIFNKFFLNKEAALVLDINDDCPLKEKITVSDFRALMKESLKYFQSWQEVSRLCGIAAELGPKDYQKMFLASATWFNLRVTICSFIAYAETVLKEDSTITYVSFLHSNQSSLEKLFSGARGCRRDSATTYHKYVTAASWKGKEKMPDNNPMYPNSLVADETQALTKITGHQDEMRDNKLKEMVAVSLTRGTAQQPVRYFSSAFVAGLTDENEKKLAAYLNANPSNKHSHLSMLERPDFRGIALISIGGPLEPWFNALCSLSPEESLVFDSDIQRINEMLFTVYAQTMAHKKTSSALVKFHKTIYEYIIRNAGNRSLLSLDSLKSQGATAHVVLTLSRLFWEKLLDIQNEIVESSQERQLFTGGPSVKGEVNRFVGWAMFSLHRKFIKEQELEWGRGNDDTKWDEKIAFMKDMRILHHEAILLPDYMANCYEPLDILSNMGGLTLVSPEYFNFGNKIMKLVAEAVDVKKFKNLGNECIKKGRKLVTENTEVREQFMECSKNSSLPEEEKKEIYNELIDKICNAKFGSVVRDYKDKNISRQGKKTSDMALRSELKATEKAKRNKAAKQQPDS